LAGGALTIWNIYLVIRLEGLYMKFRTLPTPEQLAKLILTMKIPLDELPPEIKAKAMQMIPDDLSSGHQNVGKLPKGRENYIG
jgi:hypothetical protein